MDLKEDKNKNEKSNDNIININNDLDNNDIISKKDLNKIFLKQNEDMNDALQINNKNVKNNNEINLNKRQISTNYLATSNDKNLNERLYNLELEQQLSKIKIYQLHFENIKINFKLFKESAFNHANLNVLRNEKQYLQICIQSLKNIIKNLSNPYNFNFWTKLTNIILKNIFIILKKNNFTINQNKEQSIIDQIKSMIEKKRFDENIKKRINEKITKYEADLKGGEVNRTNTENHSADKKRSFNLITIKKNNKEDKTASLIIDFLFYLKEKGNKYDHFDESILNHILFDDSIKEKNNKNEEVKNNKNFFFKTEYEGKKIFSGKELIKIFKNPLEYHRKNIKFNNLFEIIYKKIEDLKKEMGYNNSNTKLVKIINKANGLECEIKQLKEIIQMDIKNFSNIDFKNIDKININEINDEYLKKLLNNYSLLENLYKEIFDKIKFYEDKQNKFISLEKLIFGIENEINTYINIIQSEIKKNAELIQISNFFGECKIDAD